MNNMESKKIVSVSCRVSKNPNRTNTYLVTRKMTSKSSVRVATKGSKFVVEKEHLISDDK